MTLSFFVQKIIRLIASLLLVIIYSQVSAQSISGYILNEENQPIPYANIYFTELQTGTSSDQDGKYFMAISVEGEYEMIISSLGYTTKNFKIILREKDIKKNIWLSSSESALDEIVVKASKKDPAYTIIKKVQENKKKYLSQIQSSKSKVYIKAAEKKEVKEKKRKKKKKKKVTFQANSEDPLDEGMGSSGDDILVQDAKSAQAKIPKINMVEMELILNYQYPKRYKEERTAYKSYGSASGLFIPRFDDTDFNFYRNMVHLRGIAEAPVISPISRTAILSYKYKLISSEVENGQLVHKIKVIPRKSGNSTCKGFLYINDVFWNINRLDLTLNKDALMLFDGFQLKQKYQQLEDNIWIPDRIEFIYEAKQNRRISFKGSTMILYSDFEKDYAFPPKFFGNEIAITTREAYKRDTTYWKNLRPEPLTKEQQIIVHRTESIAAIRNSKVYQDSIQKKFNKVTFMDLAVDGIGFRNHEKKQRIYISSIPSLIDFELVGGLRVGPYLSYFKRWENGQILNTSGNFNIGIKNQDLQGNAWAWWYYDAHRQASASISGGRSFYSINSYDAYLNQLKTSNYILHDYFTVDHRIELVNGLYFYAQSSLANRQSIQDYDSETIIDSLFNDNEPALEFEDYQALLSTFSLSYTPRQKYMTEPNRKLVLGSKFPTFKFTYRKGWNGFLGSDVDFDFASFSISQDVILGFFGNSKYNIKMGKYLNTKDLKIVDLKRFRQSDPILYSPPLNSFQSLDTAFATTNLFIEAHHIHHFNGALINNIPLIKKTKVRVVAGAGALYILENDFHHEEIFAGLERVFRLGARRRLRIGVYGVLAKSSYSKGGTAFKISLDVIDTWKRNWSF